MKNKYTKTIKRSKRSRGSRRSRKLRNSLTHYNKLNKLQYGGEEHITAQNTAIGKRAKQRTKELLTRAQLNVAASLATPTSTYQPLGSVNLELIKQKIMQFLAAGIPKK